MGDLISREDAIDRIEKQKYREPSIGVWKENDRVAMVCYDTVIDALKRLPSAEPRWIPVEECLPKESGLYVVSIDTKGSALEVGYPDGLVYASTYDSVSMRWGYANKRVTAWMPLPEPYRRTNHGPN